MNVLGVGTDITECLRIAQMIERHGELFVGRVYTPAEIEYCRSRKQATQHFAGRWAAKEAILKALGTGWRRGISWRDIEVINAPGGRPRSGWRKKVAAAWRGETKLPPCSTGGGDPSLCGHLTLGTVANKF